MKEGYPKSDEFRAGVCKDLEPRYLRLFNEGDIVLGANGIFFNNGRVIGQVALARITRLDKFLALGPEVLDGMIFIKNPHNRYYTPDQLGEKNALYLHGGMRRVYAGSIYGGELEIRRRVTEEHEAELARNLELYFSSVNEAEIESFL